MATFAHELSHLLDIPDNYNNPYGQPPRRSFTGPWSMLSRGAFGGPGGPHSRWQVPALQGGALGSQHSVRDKLDLGLISENRILNVSKSTLETHGPVVTKVTARNVRCGIMGLRIAMGQDLSPSCNITTDPLCDGGKYDAYDFEVVDRMGTDSFQADSGVMISKVKYEARAPFQWTIDANPQDIQLVDFVRPNGTKAMITIGDYRQLLDALFHAGVNSGSKFEHIDEANGLHLYVLNRRRSQDGVLAYSVGARSLRDTSHNEYGIDVSPGVVAPTSSQASESGMFCSFQIHNNGTLADPVSNPKTAKHMKSDIYRLKATVQGSGWEVQVPNEVVAVPFDHELPVLVAAKPSAGADTEGVVTLTVTSESDKNAVGTAKCQVSTTAEEPNRLLHQLP